MYLRAVVWCWDHRIGMVVATALSYSSTLNSNELRALLFRHNCCSWNYSYRKKLPHNAPGRQVTRFWEASPAFGMHPQNANMEESAACVPPLSGI